MDGIEKDVEKPMRTAQSRYRKDFYKTFRMIPTFEVGTFVYLNRPSHAVLVFEAGKVKTASSNTLLLRVSGPYIIVTVLDGPLTILGDCNENIISSDHATKPPAAKKDQAPSVTSTKPESFP